MRFCFYSVVFFLAAAFQPGVATPSPYFEPGLPSDIIANALKSTPGGSCCAILSYVLGAKVSYPLGVSYVQSLATYWSVQASSVKPSCVVAPTSTQDVSYAVSVLSLLAKKTSFKPECRFAIKGAGHTPWAGAANQAGGVTIDLAGLNAIDVSPDRTLTGIGPGNRWTNVYSKLDLLGLAVPGGRVSSVGVGGLVTGGGISFFSPRFGFVCDSVINYEVVLACGKTVNVNGTSHPDLFRSLKGGSNNFGVVTRFDLRTFEQGPFWGGGVVYPIETRHQHFAALEKLNGAQPYDKFAALLHTYVYTLATGWSIRNAYTYTKQPAEPYPATFQPFTSIQPQLLNTLRVAPLTEFTLELGAGLPKGRESFATLTVGNSASLLSEIFDIADSVIQPVRLNPGLIFVTLAIQPLPPVVTSFGAGKNSLGYGTKEKPLINILIGFGWLNATDDAQFDTASKTFIHKSEHAARKRGLLHPVKYLNYASPWQDPIAGYGAAEKKRLQKVSKKYDHDGIFQKAVPGGFKLF